jgi:4-hydroxyphenylacetate 3-monooxygenase
MWNARGSGALDKMVALAEQCMADYDENGWRDPTWLNPDDRAAPPGGTARAAE